MILIFIFFIFYSSNFNFILSNNEFYNDIIQYNQYIYNPLETLLIEEEYSNPLYISELDKKLLILLESPDSWYNQRGKKVLLLFNETQFPEEFVILRKSKLDFSKKDKFESDFLILEEEEEREQYVNDIYNIEKNILLKESNNIDFNILNNMEIQQEINNKIYNNLSSIQINDTFSEDLEKIKYKMRIKKLINMKENIILKIQKIELEISNLENLFVESCNDPQCDTCFDYQSNLNKKYIERNKLKYRYKMIIKLLKEFVDHSNKFIFEEDINKHNNINIYNHNLNYIKKKNFIKRPNYNITNNIKYNDEINNNYLKLKEILNQLQEKIENDLKINSTILNEYDYCDKCLNSLNKCTNKELNNLLKKKDEIKLLIKNVEFFLQALSERSCPKCEDNSFNGFTQFSEIIDTQLKIFYYYKNIKNQIDNDIKSCINNLNNNTIILNNKIHSLNNIQNIYYPENDYINYINKIYKKYKKYNKSYNEFEKNIFGYTRNEIYKNFQCSNNNLILMNIYGKEIISNILSYEIEKRKLIKSKECKYCSYNDCIKCKNNSKLLNIIKNKLEIQKEWFNTISKYLQLCNFDETLYYRIFDNYSSNFQNLNQLKKNQFLWSLQEYSSESFIKKIITSNNLSLINKQNILEKIKLTLETIIIMFEFLLINNKKNKCKNCKKNQCNDCFKNTIKYKNNAFKINKYQNLLTIINLQLKKNSQEIFNNSKYKKDILKESILIKENSLIYWNPIKFKLKLQCDEETYSQSYLYYLELIENRQDLKQKINDYLTELLDEFSIKSEYHYIDIIKHWNIVWKEKIYNDELLILINEYLSSCIKKNIQLNTNFHELLLKKTEIRKLYEDFQQQSKKIDYLIKELDKINNNNNNNNDYIFLKNKLINELNDEFIIFQENHKKLNFFIYKEYNNSFYNKNNIRNNNLDYIYKRKKDIIKEDKIDKIIIEKYDIKSPIPGIKKYLYPKERKKYNISKSIILSPKIEYKCSKTEILILQEIISILSQNQNYINLIIEILNIKCEIKNCFECKIKDIYLNILKKEENFLNNILNNSSEQLDQCLLDTSLYLTKLNIIEFQNFINKYLDENSYFNNEIKNRINDIKYYDCKEKNIQQLLIFKNEILNKIYPWTEKLIINIQKLDDEDKENISRFMFSTYKFTQLYNYSRKVDEKMSECIKLINIMFDHSE